MSASQDKVQAILQTLLEQSLPLVHKGIFTSQQLQSAMCQREKHENNMLKPTFKLSDYLKAIQFQYSIERIRRSRVENLAPTNPLFKKQAKTDFVIVKRIIRLWDRTMHKFKYNVQLWKQYLDFCVKTQSKNQFYKALSNALRFLPFSADLWLIGVHYEIQIGLNLWKARKIFIKCLKMNQKNSDLWVQMFKFQINFLKTLYEREKAIEGVETMHFITNQQNQKQAQPELQLGEQGEQVKKYNNIDLSKHDDILLIVYQEAVQKISKQKQTELRNEVLSILSEVIRKQRDSEIIKILKSAMKKIQNSSVVQIESKIQEGTQQQDIKIVLEKSTFEEREQYYESILNENPNLELKELDKIVTQFLTRPILLTALLGYYLQINGLKALEYIFTSTKFKPYNLPAQLLEKIIRQILSEELNSTNVERMNKLIKNININKYAEYPKLMEWVIRGNKKVKNFKGNNDIYRGISIICKKQPEIIERCMFWIREQDLDV